MEDIPKNRSCAELGDNTRWQYIGAITAFGPWREAVKAALAVRVGICLKAAGKTDYLIRTSVSNAQKSLGPRSEHGGHVRQFRQPQAPGGRTRTSLRTAVQEHPRMNRALRVGRVPAIVVMCSTRSTQPVSRNISRRSARTFCMRTKPMRAPWPHRTSTCCGTRGNASALRVD